METKLKSLRVADLRELLQKASVPIPAKANKADLIAKIIASQAAVDTFNSQNSVKPKPPGPEPSGHDDDLLAPPEEFDWGAGSAPSAQPDAAATKSAPAPTVSKPSKQVALEAKSTNPEQTPTFAPKAAPADSSPLASAASTTAAEDAELEKRKRRADRFGIPLVEAKPKPTPPAAANGKAVRTAPKTSPSTPIPALSTEDVAKIELRAARFGTAATTPAEKILTTTASKKRERSPVPVDDAELARRKKRAERFGGGTALTSPGEAKT